MNAIDTNVFIYAIDEKDPLKNSQAQLLIERLLFESVETRIPWQVACELLANLRKRENLKQLTREEVEEYYHDFADMFPCLYPNHDVMPNYFALHQKFSLSHWDSMLLATCVCAGVTTFTRRILGMEQTTMEFE